MARRVAGPGAISCAHATSTAMIAANNEKNGLAAQFMKRRWRNANCNRHSVRNP